MRGRAFRRRRLVAVLAVGLFALLPAAGNPAPASAGPAELLPDLRMALPGDISLETTAAGVRLLRLTTVILNVGDGPFELVARRGSGSATRMTVRQRILRSDGSWTRRDTRGVAVYAGDGHDHWHVRHVAVMELFAMDGTGLRTGHKTGFCFFDTGRYRAGLPGSPAVARYPAAGCGTGASLRVRMGVSVGWGDRYGADLAYQWIDVTGVPAGTYHVRVSADPRGRYRESRERNNCSWARVELPATDDAVTVLERGRGCATPRPQSTPAATGTTARPAGAG